ncbi:DUF4395 family protein [Paenibacillus solisilvae]|uniref:DUF4395 family protein n=1 Tax=Paenibacillus solisilvae TaxID=2486751 RepID=A0ABW0VYD9_9BACL
MKEVPIIYVKANQLGIVTFVLLSLLLQQPVLLAVLWAVQVLGLASQGKGNLFVAIAKKTGKTFNRLSDASVGAPAVQ